MIALPIDEVMPEVVATLRDHRQVVLQAPPGAGKSTRVPPALLDAGVVGEDQKIIVLEPRRVAARAVASRIADERNQRLGGEIGYAVRFDRKTSDKTRVEIVTEGMLLRRLQHDPLLDGVGCVILDEFHERSIHADLTLAMLKEVRTVREDLSLVVMSATLETERVSDYLDAPSVTSEGRTFPVDVLHVKPDEDNIPGTIARQVRQVLTDEDEGDILVFLPGARSIQDTVGALKGLKREFGLDVFPLYGALPLDEQIRAITSDPDRRRVIVSTNIAETSLTVEGVTTVIDAGFVKQLVVDPSSGLDRLEKVRIALDSAKQRAGRAGRVRPGRAIRLWTAVDEQFMSETTEPEILRVDLTATILEVIGWSGADPRDFDWFDRPGEQAIDAAIALLRRLGAIDAEGYALTPAGEALLEIPAHPRLGRMLLEGHYLKVAHEVAGAAALLSEDDFVRRAERDAPPAECDLWRRVEILDEVARDHFHSARRLGLRVSAGAARRVRRVRKQLLHSIRGHEGALETPADLGLDPPARFRRAVMMGYPDRICFQRARDSAERDYVMVGGEPVTLSFESAVHDAPVLVASHVAGSRRDFSDTGVTRRKLIRLATTVELEWLEAIFPDRMTLSVEVDFDWEKERVRAEEVMAFDGIALERQTASVQDHGDPEAVARMLAKAASEDLVRAFSPNKDEAQLLDRIAFLRNWAPELELPDLGPEPAGEERDPEAMKILTQWCWGKRAFYELRRQSLKNLLRGSLSHEQWSAIGSYAPARIKVPSGSNIRLDYGEPDQPPVLAVRIQEVFGLTETPTIARGRVPVMLHLLAPNFRPAQVTQDLASFWENTYPQVRKELRARYSKHPWPEDPLSARAVYK